MSSMQYWEHPARRVLLLTRPHCPGGAPSARHTSARPRRRSSSRAKPPYAARPESPRGRPCGRTACPPNQGRYRSSDQDDIHRCVVDLDAVHRTLDEEGAGGDTEIRAARRRDAAAMNLGFARTLQRAVDSWSGRQGTRSSRHRTRKYSRNAPASCAIRAFRIQGRQTRTAIAATLGSPSSPRRTGTTSDLAQGTGVVKACTGTLHDGSMRL